DLLAKGGIERIGLAEGILTHKPTGKDKYEVFPAIPDHTVGINLIIGAITDPKHGVIKLEDINAVGHRVAHGGEFFNESVKIDADVKAKIEQLFELAPLHNPAHMKGILAIEKLLPKVEQVAVFDTSFHQTIPQANYMYALPYKYYKELKVRKYGFHGTSHKYVAEKSAEFAGIDINSSKIITCHIGNGASITAVLNGKSFDTSMGFTPVDGLVMGTRSGLVDPGALLYIANKEGLSLDGISDLVNKKSGLLGLSEVSNDMRDIHSAVEKGDKKAEMALDVFINRIKFYIGAYAAEMNGVDMIVFTGGVGENDNIVRKAVCEGISYLGVDFNEANNNIRGTEVLLSKPSSKVKVVICPTDEELVIASDTYKLVK
ncbi:MAG: acetate kinase, partial [Rikenellaceae bacterium]